MPWRPVSDGPPWEARSEVGVQRATRTADGTVKGRRAGVTFEYSGLRCGMTLLSGSFLKAPSSSALLFFLDLPSSYSLLVRSAERDGPVPLALTGSGRGASAV